MNETLNTLEFSIPARGRGGPMLPALTILAHPDHERVGEWSLMERVTALSRLEPAFIAIGGTERRGLLDPFLSRKPVVLGIDAQGVRLDATRTSIRVTANDLPVDAVTTFTDADLDRGVVLNLKERVVLLLHKAPMSRRRPQDDMGLIGHSAGMSRVRNEIRQVADVDVAVLLRGESGVGKELVALALHNQGPRRDKPMVAVNMAAVPTTLASSELFGHRKGAFSGADRDRDGSFAQADKGTLFLDEIGDTPMEVQPLLLRALETGEIQPVGASSTHHVDVRLVAATDADLEAAVDSGAFRLPLLQRVAGFQLVIPPLRERREDIGRLLYHFLRDELASLGASDNLKVADDQPPYVPAGLVARLAAYNWPGNVRQLRNVVRQLAIASRDEIQLLWEDRLDALLPVRRTAELPVPAAVLPVAVPAPRKVYRSPDEVNDEELVEALRSHAWRLAPAATALGVSRTTMYALVEASKKVRKAADLDAGEIEAALEKAGGRIAHAAAFLEVSTHALKIRMTALGLEK